MKRTVFCSHGRLCEGMLDTLKIFSLYDENTMSAIPFYTEGVDAEEQLNKIEERLGAQDQLLIFTDVAFGSVNQAIMARFQTKPNCFIVTGMNLMVVLELLAVEGALDEALVLEKVEAARPSILFTRKMSLTIGEEDE